jgi:hypothetical protein
MVWQVCNPSTQEVDTGGSWLEASLGCIIRPCLSHRPRLMQLASEMSLSSNSICCLTMLLWREPGLTTTRHQGRYHLLPVQEKIKIQSVVSTECVSLSDHRKVQKKKQKS